MQLKYSSQCYMWMALYILIQTIATVDSLKCYACKNCNEEAVAIQECGNSENVCLKLDLGKVVTKGCTREELCNLKDIERVFGNLWSKLSGVFREENRRDDDSEDMISCCDNHFCNGGNIATNWLGFSGALVLSFIVVQFHG